MPLTSEQQKFSELFAQKLRAKVDQQKIPLPPGDESKIAMQFVLSLIEYKELLTNNPLMITQRKGELTWSEPRADLLQQLAKKLDQIFAPVGGIKPAESSAFWSGEALQQAVEYGLDFGHTIPGFVINQVHQSLIDIFMPKAYTQDGQLDTAINVGMWDALSQLYAEGTLGDAHVFLVDGETSAQSIFWNSELQQLRQKQQRGDVSHIYLHTLKVDVLKKYRQLLTEKKACDPKNTTQLGAINEKISLLLKNKNNWSSANLDSSAEFKLKTSGFEPNAHLAVHYQTLKNTARQFKELLRKTLASKTVTHKSTKEPSNDNLAKAQSTEYPLIKDLEKKLAAILDKSDTTPPIHTMLALKSLQTDVLAKIPITEKNADLPRKEQLQKFLHTVNQKIKEQQPLSDEQNLDNTSKFLRS